MPAANERALEKAKGIPADAVIFDLEDAVAPDAKVGARDRACAAAASGGYGRRELAIRVNGLGTAWHADDLRAAAAAGPDAVLVPKVGSAADVHAIEAALEAAGAPERTRLWAMLETATAVLDAREIARASERLTVLVLGTNDLAQELRALPGPGRQPLLAALQLCVLAARAAGKVVLDGVHNDTRDLSGFEAECQQGRQLGFDGKTLIHPGQVEPSNRIFAPTPEELEHAGRVVEAFEDAERRGLGVVTVDGRMVEQLHVDGARRALARAAAIAGRSWGAPPGPSPRVAGRARRGVLPL
jgi:citrate lyase subunit beta/citryl-CoA lyase